MNTKQSNTSLAGRWLKGAGASSTHTHARTHAHAHTLTAVELQVCILLCAAKALCGSLKGRLFGRGKDCRRCLLLVR